MLTTCEKALSQNEKKWNACNAFHSIYPVRLMWETHRLASKPGKLQQALELHNGRAEDCGYAALSHGNFLNKTFSKHVCLCVITNTSHTHHTPCCQVFSQKRCSTTPARSFAVVRALERAEWDVMEDCSRRRPRRAFRRGARSPGAREPRSR